MPRLPSVDVEGQVDRLRNRWPTVGFAIGVVRPGEPAQVVVQGLADMGSGAAVGPDTALRIASITKTLTAVTVMTLVEDGVVDLEGTRHTTYLVTRPRGEATTR